MEGFRKTERKLAVMTNWAFLGSFGLCLAVSGFAAADLVAGLLGFALVALGFCAHVVINHIFRTGFSEGEVALGFVVFTVSMLSFVVGWIVAPDFGNVQIAIGLAGFGALIACFIFYMAANYGVRGSIAMLDEARKR